MRWVLVGVLAVGAGLAAWSMAEDLTARPECDRRCGRRRVKACEVVGGHVFALCEAFKQEGFIVVCPTGDPDVPEGMVRTLTGQCVDPLNRETLKSESRRP